MANIVEQLKPADEQGLLALSKSHVQVAYLDYVSLEQSHSSIQFSSCLLLLDDAQMLKISNDWGETPNDWLDYYFLKVELLPQAERKSVEMVDGQLVFPEWPYEQHRNSFCTGAEQKVVEVQVLEYTESGEQESVQYDAGLLVKLGNGAEIAIVRELSISGALNMAYEKEGIKSLMADLSPRLIFRNGNFEVYRKPKSGYLRYLLGRVTQKPRQLNNRIKIKVKNTE